MRLPNAKLAFLSACETATGDEYQPDESIHLAAGMLVAGFGNVIATMWTIQDSAAPRVADRVYAELFKKSDLDTRDVASALHFAVENLRNVAPDDFASWIPFIHVCST